MNKLLANGLPVSGDLKVLQDERIEAAFAFAKSTADNHVTENARQMASALYHVVTMAGMRWEAKQAKMPMRGRLADLVLKHKLCARDPINDGALSDPGLVEWLAGPI